MKTTEREFWTNHKDIVEHGVTRLVGFPVELYWVASVVTGVGKKDSYQIMPRIDAERERSVFWYWHLEHHEQWFRNPLEAATAFVRAWRTWLAEAGPGCHTTDIPKG